MNDSRIDALKQALKMEEDGRNYYKQAMDKVESKLAKDVFKYLIKAEEQHIKKINQLYSSLTETGQWPDVALTRGGSERLTNIFAAAMADPNKKVKGTTTDIEALKAAAKLEDDGIKYYQAKSDKTDDPFEKKFYLLLVHEEGEHFISLLDTIAFLEDPQGYFGQLERGTMSF